MTKLVYCSNKVSHEIHITSILMINLRPGHGVRLWYVEASGMDPHGFVISCGYFRWANCPYWGRSRLFVIIICGPRSHSDHCPAIHRCDWPRGSELLCKLSNPTSPLLQPWLVMSYCHGDSLHSPHRAQRWSFNFLVPVPAGLKFQHLLWADNWW